MGARALAFAVSCACAAVSGAQQTHVLIITGLGAEPQYTERFKAAGAAMFQTARQSWKLPAANVTFLSEDPALGGGATGKSTKEEIAKAFTGIAQRAGQSDIVLVFIVGHGSGEGADSKVSLPGPDPTAADFNLWLSLLSKQRVVFVNAASGSGDFVKVLGLPNRVIVTATKTSMERNESIFAGHFAKGLVSGEADADKDARVSVLEAFEFAKKEVAREYEQANKLMTEHAIISDTTFARMVAFGAPVSDDPRVLALVAERQALEDSLTTLRGRKAQMDSTAYQGELERLLLAIAEKTKAINAAKEKK
jgi:hypothetical protein